MLHKRFQNEATEYLSRIKLEDYKTENTLGIQEHYTDVIDGNEISWTSNVEKLTMGDFLGITSLEGGNGRGELINIPQALRDFTDMFVADYESIKDQLKNENGKQITLEQYLTYLETMGEFQNTMDKPVAQFFSMLLDITIVIPLIEACWGYDLVTGEDLSDLDRGLKLVFAIIDIATLGSGVLATESLTMGATVIGKTMLIDLASVSAAYGVGKIGEELDLPLPITLLLSMGTGMAVSRVAGKIVLQDGVGNVILEADAEAVESVMGHGAAEAGGMVWNEITGTAENVPGTEIPATFQIKLEDGIQYSNPLTGDETLWTNANATEHMGEYVGRFGEASQSIGIRSQEMLESYSAALNEAMRDLSLRPLGEYEVTYGGWTFGINTETGVVYHAMPTQW